MIAKVLSGVCISLLLVCIFLYNSLDSAKSSVTELNDKVVALEQTVREQEEEMKKAESLRKKHEEIIGDLFSDQDNTQDQFDDLMVKFNALKGCKKPAREVKSENNTIDSSIVDFNQHKRVFDQAACIAGDKASCSSLTPLN